MACESTLKRIMKIGFWKWSLGLGLSLGLAGVQAVELEEGPMVGGLKDLKRLNQKLISMSERCAEATVAIVSKGGGGTGSGVVVSEDGLILTAAHVVEALNGEVVVIFPDGTRKSAEVLGGEFDRDAAMVRITEEGEYPFVELAKGEALERNQWCVALGHPGGFDPSRRPPVRLGRVLGLRDFIETDCAVVGGDSGGPLFDVEGRLIGIHSNIGMTLSQNRHVPLSVYLEHWEMMEDGKRQGSKFASKSAVDQDRPVMGVQLGEPAAGGGVIVEGVMKDSPAAKAGLEAGDVIMLCAGRKVRSSESLINMTRRFEVGKKLHLTYKRDGKRLRAQITLVRLGDLVDEPEERKQPRPRGRRSEGADRKPAERAEGKEDAEEDRQARLKLEEKFKESFLNGVPLELTPDQLEKLGGGERLAGLLRDMMEGMTQEQLKDLAERGPSIEMVDPFFASVVTSLEPLVSKAGSSTVLVHVNGKPTVLGTVVSEDGWILTKNEETLVGQLKVQVGHRSFDAEVVERFPKRDLALLSIESDELKPVRWAKGRGQVQVGSLLTSPSESGEAMGVGLISVKERAFGNVGFLGIQTEQANKGIRIMQVVPKSSAAKCGLKKGDVILELEGDPVADPLEFGSNVRALRAGDVIDFLVDRGGDELDFTVELGPRPEGPVSDRFQRMNELAGPLSSKSSGYPSALQHDMPLAPEQCGGPVLNLRGECIAINVSRAGRVKTLAIPASDVLELLEGVEAERVDEGPDQADLEAVRELIEEVQDNLSELQERLEELEAR